MRVTRASDVLWPTLIAARCHAWASDSFADPEASVSSPLIVDAADTTFHALPAFVTPIVTRPPPDAATPPGVWRSVIAWVSLAARRESLTCVRPASELSRNSARLRSSHARAAAPAPAPPTVAPSAPPGRTSDDGVPNSFHATSARSALTSDLCAAVGASFPERTSRSGRPGADWTSAATAGPTETSVPTQTSASTDVRGKRMASPPKDGRRPVGPRRAAFIHLTVRRSRHGVRHRARATQVHRLVP